MQTTNTETNSQLQTFKFPFSEKILNIYGTWEDPLFQMKELGEFLELSDIHKTVAQLPLKYKVLISTPTLGGNQDMVYLTEPGLNRLLMLIRPIGQRKELVENFQDWVCSDVLPSIRKHGYYLSDKANEHKLEQDLLDLKEKRARVKRVEAECFLTYCEIFEKIGRPDDRDRLNFRDYLRSIYFCEDSEENKEISISKRLLEHFKISTYDHGLVTEIGRKFASQYREIREQDPPSRDQYVGGTVRSVNHYTLKDYLEFGDNVISECLQQRNSTKPDVVNIQISGKDIRDFLVKKNN